MNRFAICNEIFKSWPLEDAFSFIAKTGYDAVEIAPFTLAPLVTDIPANRRTGIRELAKRNGLSISAIHWVLAQTQGLQITSKDAEIRKRTAAYLVDLVNFCSDIGGRFMVFGSPKQREIEAGTSPKQAWDWATGVIAEVIKRAEDREITFCFEPLGPGETNFINRAKDAIDFIKQFKSPRAKIILDVKAMSSEGTPIPQILKESWPHFAYVHANDPNLKGPGFGNVDFTPIASTLKSIGYSGYVSVEVFDFTEGPEVIATKSLDCLKKAFAAPTK